MSRPSWRVDKVRRPSFRVCDDNDPVVESRIIATTTAHICFGNVTSTCDPFSHQRTLGWRQ